MDRADSPKWIWNRFWFRRLHHALLGYFWWYTEAFLPSFPSQTMRVRSRAYVILTTTFLAVQCTHQSPVTDVHPSVQHSAEVRPNVRTRSVSPSKPSASAECHNLTFGPSLLSRHAPVWLVFNQVMTRVRIPFCDILTTSITRRDI